MIKLYTDGSSRGNPGPGGYGIVLIYNNFRKEISNGFRLTTNNRMELMAVIVGLEEIKLVSENIQVISDSKYIVDSVSKGWLFEWEKKNFKGKKNIDLWRRFLVIYKKLNIEFIWVKGHSNVKENERCDYLANNSIKNQKLLEDEGYTRNLNSQNSLFE